MDNKSIGFYRVIARENSNNRERQPDSTPVDEYHFAWNITKGVRCN